MKNCGMWIYTLVFLFLFNFILQEWLFTDGPTKKQIIQYPWVTSDIIYHIHLNCYGTGIDPDFVLSLINAESQGSMSAVSCVGARGLMQVMPFHCEPDPLRLHQTGINISIGCSYLRYCMRLAHGDLIETLKNYNAGPGSGFYNMPYIKKVIRNYMVSKNITTEKDSQLTWNALLSML